MKKLETKQTETTVTRYYCDYCGSELKTRLKYCDMCGSDICDDCIGETIDDWGDYPHHICKHCSEIGKPYKEKMGELEKQIDVLYDEWLNKCNHEKQN
jgi:hypothetical protein